MQTDPNLKLIPELKSDEIPESGVGGVPGGGVFGLVALEVEAFADDVAEGGKICDVAQGHGLDEEVAGGRGFGGAGDDGFAAGIGGHLVEQFVLAAAADDVDD